MDPEVISRIRHGVPGRTRTMLPESGPWWQGLPEDFALRPERFDLGAKDAATVTATSVSDVFVRTMAAYAVGTLAFPLGFHPLELRRSLKDLDFYGPMAESGDPSRFFQAPPPGIRIHRGRIDMYPRFDPPGGKVETLRWDSPFMPRNPRLHRKYLRAKGNRTAHARYWRHDDGPRPTLVAIHGFSADFYLVNEWFFALPWFYRMGCDVVLFTLPFHGRRQPLGSPFSGHGFFAGGASHINEAVAQAVMDFRVLVDWLEAQGVRKVGATGVSLGGYTTAMLACAEPRLAFAIPNVPVVSMPDLVLEWEPLGTALRAGLKLLRRSLVDARHLLAVANPLTYRPALDKDRLMIVGGVGDRLAPPKHSRLLWEHWGRPKLHWFPGSHLLHLDRGEYLEAQAMFLRRLDFLPDT